mgnify:CR=1 FL=1
MDVMSLCGLVGVMAYPDIDPVALQLGPVAIRWYSLAYLVGLLGGMYLMRRRADQEHVPYTADDAYDFLVWCTVGLLLGARLGLVLFYYPEMIWQSPHRILAMWEGGMSFHGGAIGVLVATLLFCRRRGIPFLQFADEITAAAPLGLLAGRVANFINGELWGRTSDVPWAMVFPSGGPEPRHPSQLYEALTEGLLLLILVNVVRARFQRSTGPGVVAGTFLTGYAVARFSMEFFREPDDHLGFLFLGATMGQLLTLPMLIAGIVLISRGIKAGPEARRAQGA